MNTSEDRFLSAYGRVLGNDNTLFWALQAVGWTGISLLTYLSLSVPYDQYEIAYLAHNISQSVVGLLISIPLRPVFRIIWNWTLPPRLVVVMLATVICALLWASIRLTLFMLMTGERGLWPDFGGWLFPSMFVFFTWAALYHGIKYYQLLQREREAFLKVESLQRQEALKLAQAESDVRSAQLALLRYQLNPHFLFNTLNSVNALVARGDARGATTMITKLSEFFRHSLRAEPEREVTLAEEIATTELYLDIEKTRFADRLTVEIEIADSAKSRLVPPMILQPLVENSLKHAIGVSERGGHIRIVASEADSGVLELRVEDSGPEVSDYHPNHRPPGASVGLDNTRTRLHAFYGDGGRLQIEQADIGGYSVLVEVPPSGAGPINR